MTNQASEDELDAILAEYFTWKGEAIHEIHATQNYKRMKAAIQSIIRTEKLKLLAEVRSNLLEMRELKENRDDKGTLWGSYDVVDLDDIQGLLTKLEAEL